MTIFTPFRLIVAAAATAVAAACAIPIAAENAAPLPLRCALERSQSGGSVLIEGRLEAVKPVFGSYDLAITRSGSAGSARIAQGGDFALAAGETALLGSATLNGPVSGIEAKLTLTWEGRTYSCPLASRK